MIHFFPKHKLTSEELSLIPEALFCLISARFSVSFLPSRYWLHRAAQGTGHRAQSDGRRATGEGLRAKGEEKTKYKSIKTKVEFAPKDQKSQFTNQNSKITNNRLQDGTTAGPQDTSTLNLEPGTWNIEHGTLNRQIESSKLISSLVNGLALRTPWKSTCLVKALAAQKMFQKRHIPYSIHFGMKKNDTGKYEAHAWVSADGRILIGGENVEEFKEVGRFEG